MDLVDKVAKELKQKHGKTCWPTIDENLRLYQEGMTHGAPYDEIEFLNEMTKGLPILTKPKVSKSAQTRKVSTRRSSGRR